MGTRGCFGVRVDGADKLTYNHWSSGPDGLGKKLVAQLKQMRRTRVGRALMVQQARELQLVNEFTTPTPEQIERLHPHADLRVGDQKLEDWYHLTRKLQGDLAATLKAGVMIDSHEFMSDSLFCEYAYVVNLDDNLFEAYRGFQTERHSKGRYGAAWQDPYLLAAVGADYLEEHSMLASARVIREIVSDYKALRRGREPGQDRDHDCDRDTYYPVALVGAFQLDAIPDNWAELAYPTPTTADAQGGRP